MIESATDAIARQVASLFSQPETAPPAMHRIDAATSVCIALFALAMLIVLAKIWSLVRLLLLLLLLVVVLTL
jgi:hypothetical protein